MNDIALLQEQMNQYEHSLILMNSEMNLLKRKNKYLLDKIETLESIKQDTVTILSILKNMQRETKEEKNKIVILSYEELFTQFENEFFKEKSFGDSTIIFQLQNKILYEQNQNTIDKDNLPLKFLFYILIIIFVKTKKAESLKKEIEILFDNATNNQGTTLEKLVNMSNQINTDFIDLNYIHDQFSIKENSENELLLFFTKIFYYFIKEGNNFVNVFISVIINDNYYLEEKYVPGLNLILKYAFICDMDESTFLININNIFYLSKWYFNSQSKERNNPSKIEINLLNTIYSHIKEKHCLAQYVLRNIAYIDKLNYIIPLLFEITNESEQLPIIFKKYNESLTKLIHLPRKNPFFSYQIYYFVIFWRDYISKDTIEKIKRIKLFSDNKSNEKIDIHFLFSFLHSILRTMLLSPQVQENNILSQSFISINTKDTIINPFEIMHYEDFEGEDCFTKEQAFFQKYIGIPNVISVIPKLNFKEDNFIQLYKNHFKDNINAFNEFPFIVYHPFSLKNKKLNKNLLTSIKEIEINDKLFYEFTGIITSKEIYIYNQLKEQLYYVNKDIWINLLEITIPTDQEISLVYYKVESRDDAILSINIPLECKEKQSLKKFTEGQQEKIIIDSFLWLVKEYFNWILKNKTFFIKFFKLVDPIRIQELYNVYKQQTNPNVQKFCLDLINKYEKKVKKLDETLIEIKIQLKLWTPDEFDLNFKNYLFGDVSDKTIMEKKIVHFINYYLEHFEDISNDNNCKVVTLLTSLILIKQYPDNDYLLKISVGSTEKMNKHVLKLTKSIKSNIEEHQLKEKVSTYWKNCTSSEKLSETLNCDLMFSVAQKLTKVEFKTFLDTNQHFYREKFEDQYNLLFNYIHDKLYKSSYRLYCDLICIFFESSPLFISKGKNEPSIIEWKLFEHYIKEIICNETIVLTFDVSSTKKEEQINIAMSILLGRIGESKNNQTLLIDYFGLLRNGNILLQKCIREQLNDYTKNINYPDLQFMIISFFYCCKIKRKTFKIENFVESFIPNHKLSDWTWIDVHYLFISLYKNIQLSANLPKETFFNGLEELYKDKKKY